MNCLGIGVPTAYSSGSLPTSIRLNFVLTSTRSPVWRHWLDELSRDHLFVRYDERGCGLSDWSVEDFSFEAWVRDLESVVDDLALVRPG